MGVATFTPFSHREERSWDGADGVCMEKEEGAGIDAGEAGAVAPSGWSFVVAVYCVYVWSGTSSGCC